jgi:nicotinamidase/pyrazinamidase
MKVLILVDLQVDFLPGGALAVSGGNEVIPLANQVQEKFDLIFATQDWHPPDHGSFAVNHPGKKLGDLVDLNGLTQILWPVHCVEDTRGAELAPGLDTSRIHQIFFKGTDRTIDSYSGFYDNGHRKSTGLGEAIRAQGVKEVYLLGLATDYCVKFSALDAVSLGFKVFVIQDGCRAVNLSPNDGEKAFQEMAAQGVTMIQSIDLMRNTVTTARNTTDGNRPPDLLESRPAARPPFSLSARRRTE